MILCGAGLVCGWSGRGIVAKCLNDAVWGRSGMWLVRARHCGKMFE